MPAVGLDHTPWAPLLVRVANDPQCWAGALNAGALAAGISVADFGTITDDELAVCLPAALAWVDAHPPRSMKDLRAR